MTTMIRWALVVVLAGHGLLHLLGAAQGFGLADVPQLTQPIGPMGALLWLLAAALVLTATASLATRARVAWWWAVALGAAVVSQIAVATSWGDARTGTVVNVLLVLAAGYGFAAEGPVSLHAEYRHRAAEATALVRGPSGVLDETGLAGLPDPLAAYIRRSGAVGKPRVLSFHADFHGRIRSGPGAAWMPFTGHQVNTYGRAPRRVFLMDATRAGLPVTVLHVFLDAAATMRVRLLSLFTVVDASGPEMDRGETVTVFDDLVVMAPGAIVGAAATWTAVDPLHVRGEFTAGDETVSALLTFDADHDLVDVTSDDRSVASPDGRTFTRQRWSTPLAGHRDADGQRVLTSGRGVWHPGPPEVPFTYLEFDLDTITFNRDPDETSTAGQPIQLANHMRDRQAS